jgi:hypothetical protein
MERGCHMAPLSPASGRYPHLIASLCIVVTRHTGSPMAFGSMY